MPIPRLTSEVQSFNRLNELPRELPTLPVEVATRFPQMVEWQERWSKWWFSFRTILQEKDLTDLLKATISDLANFKGSTAATLANLQEQIDTLEAELAAIQAQVAALDLSAINSAILALQVLTAFHSSQLSTLTILVNNNAVLISNLTALINANAIPLIVFTNPGENPIWPPIVGVSGIFGNQRAVNTFDGALWTWVNGVGWVAG